MKKIVSISVLLLLVVLTGSKTLAYWHGGDISFPPLFRVQSESIKIGAWDFENEDTSVIINPEADKKLYKGQVVLIGENYYYIHRSQNWTINPNDPWNNPYKVYGNQYKKGNYYATGSFVIKDNHIFRAHNEGSSNNFPLVGKNEYIWTDLGSLDELTWNKDMKIEKDKPIYWQGKIYLKNGDFRDNIEPGTGPGYNLYNEFDFDAFTIYEGYYWMKSYQNPVVRYNGKIYTLIARTNKKGDKYIKPGEDKSIWQEGFVTDEKR